MNPLVESQLEELRQSGLEVETDVTASGAVVILVRGVALPQGWSKPTTDVMFIAPVGYPLAQPDSFWADPDLKLADGLAPQASRAQPVPETNAPGTWFSWHVSQWNPNTDSLAAYFRLIRQRLQDPK